MQLKLSFKKNDALYQPPSKFWAGLPPLFHYHLLIMKNKSNDPRLKYKKVLAAWLSFELFYIT